MGKELKRMRYFDGLFLDKDDYKLDQDYQRRMLQLHNRYMHTSGIVTGLEVIPSIAKTEKTVFTALKTKVETENKEENKEIPVPDGLTDKERCTAVVSEGMALNNVKEKDEDISQQIYIYSNPTDPTDRQIDLSVHPANEDIYISVSYLEENADKSMEKGNDEEIHILERGRISHSTAKPEDEKKDIVIARARLGLARKVNTTIETTKNVGEDGKFTPETTTSQKSITIAEDAGEALKTTMSQKTTKNTNNETGETTTDFIVTKKEEGVSETTDKTEVTTTVREKDNTIKSKIIKTDEKTYDSKTFNKIATLDRNIGESFDKKTGVSTKTTKIVAHDEKAETNTETIKEKNTIKKTKIIRITDTDTDTTETLYKGTITNDEITNKPINKATGTFTTKNTVTINENIEESIEAITQVKTESSNPADDTATTKVINKITTIKTNIPEETNIPDKTFYTLTRSIDETSGNVTISIEGKTTVVTEIVTTDETTKKIITETRTETTETQMEETTEKIENGILITTTTVENPIKDGITIKTKVESINQITGDKVTESEDKVEQGKKKTTIVKKYIVQVRGTDETTGLAILTTTINTEIKITDKIKDETTGEYIDGETITETKKETTMDFEVNEAEDGTIVKTTIDVSPVKYIGIISCYEEKGGSVRKYTGPAGNELTIEKMVFNLKGAEGKMPFIRSFYQEGNKVGLEVDSPTTNFTGSINVKGDLIIKGKLDDNGSSQTELSVSNSFVQVNSRAETIPWSLKDGGLQVYRGETEQSMDACLMWSEERQRWQVGYKYKADPEDTDEINFDFHDLAYGEPWERLINSSVVDDMHKHSKLSYGTDRVALEIDNTGNLSMNGNLSLNDKTLLFRSKENTNHGLGWYGNGKKFADIAVDGPVLFGLNGGILGTAENGEKAVLTWNTNGNVGIGVKNPIDDKLEVGGSLRILKNTNPIRFTSKWTGFPDAATNQAEISNDTSYHKALMIVGNKSAGQGRKVAIWDRLDVNGYLYVNGNMQITKAINPSTGNGPNGIVFPSDPGGGSGDSAWIKYYARNGEACNLEIGTSNDANDNIVLNATGNVGIGTTNPADKFDVNGNMRILSGTNPVRFTSAWGGVQNMAINQAEISNDTVHNKSLMIVGNKSSGTRKVSIWDNLDVNGSLKVNGDLKTVCAIVPSVGRGENNGISFPKDYYGGSGDAAWIRYFSDTARGGGENMTLEIGISNDSGNGSYYSGGDRIRLYATGGVYVDGYFYYSSSRDLKENIKVLSSQKAKRILDELNPVSFNFKGDTEKTTMGFIAEEVPTEVAANDQKAISPLEIVAVLTSVVKEQRKLISTLQQQIESM